MRLHRIHIGGGETGVGQGVADDALLGGADRGGQAVARAVLVDGTALDDGEDAVAVPPGVGQALHDEEADPLRPRGAVGRGGEGLGAPVGGQAALAGELHEHAGRRHDGGAARDGQVGLAGAQRTHRHVQGDQRGRAGRVDGDGRSEQPELVGDASGHDARRGAGEEMSFDGVGGLVHPGAVVEGGGAHEHPGAAALEGGGVQTGALDGLPGGLQEEALLGVHGEGLAGRDPEELVVEQGGVVQEAALADGAVPAVGGVGVVQVGVPAAVAGEAGYGVPAVGDQVPQLLG